MLIYANLGVITLDFHTLENLLQVKSYMTLLKSSSATVIAEKSATE